MIGCGGSGQKSIRYVRDSVSRRLAHAGWTGEFPRSWQFIGLDTLNTQDSPGEIPTMPQSDFKSISLGYNKFAPLADALLARHRPGSDGYRALIGWRPLHHEVVVPIAAGAGQLRAVGRTAGLLAMDEIVRPKLQHAFTELSAGFAELQRVSEALGEPATIGETMKDPLIVVVGSMAGGTGAGTVLDVIELVRRTDLKGGYPVAVVFTADIFGAIATDEMAANGLAFMSELMSAYWDSEVSAADLALIPSYVPADQRGPHSTFLVGRKNFEGKDLGSSQQVYRAVGEAMGTWITSGPVSDSLNEFVKTNWPTHIAANRGGYGFGAEFTDGVVSSFGAASVSIGRDRFREFATKLLMHEILKMQYQGFLKVAQRELGTEDKNLSVDGKITRIVEKNFVTYLQACKISERGKSDNQITNLFVSNEIVSEMLAKVSQDLRSAFSGQQLSPDQWYRSLMSQAAGVVKPAAFERIESETNRKIGAWGLQVFEQVLRVSSMYTARLSMRVVQEMARRTQHELSDISGELRQEAREFRDQSELKIGSVQGALLGAGKGKLGLDSKPVQDAVSDISKSIVLEIKSIIFERLAIAIGSLGGQVFAQLSSALQQGLSIAESALVPAEGGVAAIAESWPENDGSVPAFYSPSPVEFYLEDHHVWPQRLKELIARSLPELEENEVLPSDPIDAACYAIVRGSRSRGGVELRELPLIWSESYVGGQPQWSPGNTPNIQVGIDVANLEEKVTYFMRRPSTPLATSLSEGLKGYLARNDSAGMAIPDHQLRINKFKTRLEQAYGQSKPLIEIDRALSDRVHKKNIEFTPIIQRFPFGTGDPARKIVEDLLRVQLAPGAPLDEYFSSADTESVLLSSFLKYPIHPACVTSFVKPVAQALTNLKNDAAQLRGSFWLWRRTKVLEDFIPLPDEARRSVIRGFAVGRLLGFVTADPRSALKISGEEGPVEFPFPLLTQVSQDNILPALLESFVLTFGKVSTIGEKAFEPYKRLYELGEGHGAALQFVAIGALEEFLKNGSTAVEPVDEEQRKKFTAGANTKEERCQKMIANLEINLRRYNVLQGSPLTGQETRSKTGNVLPEDTLSHELIKDLIRCYGEVKTALEIAAVGSAV